MAQLNRETPKVNYCFTLNNFTEFEKNDAIRFIQSHCKYGIFQSETGESGTPHLQGYFQLSKKNRMSWLKSTFSARAHYECAKGTWEQNKDYCSKEEARMPGTEVFEHGRPPETGKRNDLAPVVESVLAKRSIGDIALDHPEEFIKFSRGILTLAAAVAEPRTWKTEVFWFYGPTGTGKSLRAFEMAPNAYWKAGGTKWWDGYDGQEDVIIDDYRCDLCPFHELLRLLDRYPMRVEFKGGSTHFRARRVFITTPSSPRDTWSGRTEEALAQLLRRVEHIENFTWCAHYVPPPEPVVSTCAPGYELGPQGLEPSEPPELIDDPFIFDDDDFSV